MLLNHQLVLLPDNGPAAETQAVLEPLGDGRFRLMAPTGGDEVGEVVRFEEKDGKVTRIITGDTWAERIADW